MHNSVTDYYTLLEVSRDAAADDIKKAFRVLAHRFHPDKNPGDVESEEMFKNISMAYEVLGDPQKRLMYDRTGHSSYNNMFSSGGGMHGGGMGCGRRGGCGGRGRAGANFTVHDIAVTKEEALAGITIDVGVDKGEKREVFKVNLPGNIENGTVLRYSDSNIGADIFIRVLYTDE
jgi:molecular chaperone DnaJ